MVLDTHGGQVFGQHLFRETGLFLIKVDGNQLERDRRALLQVKQDIEHGVRVFSAAEAAHDFVTGLNHRKIGNRLPDFAAQTFLQLVQLQLLAALPL